MIRIATVALSALLLALPAAAQDHKHDHDHGKHQHDEDDGHHEHGAHVHGVAWLDVAVDAGTVELRLKGTGADIADLEGSPADAADVAKVDAARRTLGDAAMLFAFQPEGACVPAAPAQVTPPPSALQAPGANADSGHGDWEAGYQFRCTTAPRALELRLFDRFASLETVQAQILGPAGQTAAELTPGARRIDIQPAD
jgi:hypothetical protein